MTLPGDVHRQNEAETKAKTHSCLFKRRVVIPLPHLLYFRLVCDRHERERIKQTFLPPYCTSRTSKKIKGLSEPPPWSVSSVRRPVHGGAMWDVRGRGFRAAARGCKRGISG